MDKSDIKRLALVLAVQAEIEAMKVANIIRAECEESLVYSWSDFKMKADELRELGGVFIEE